MAEDCWEKNGACLNDALGAIVSDVASFFTKLVYVSFLRLGTSEFCYELLLIFFRVT